MEGSGGRFDMLFQCRSDRDCADLKQLGWVVVTLAAEVYVSGKIRVVGHA